MVMTVMAFDAWVGVRYTGPVGQVWSGPCGLYGDSSAAPQGWSVGCILLSVLYSQHPGELVSRCSEWVWSQ